MHSHFNCLLENGPYTLKYYDSMWGYKWLFKRTNLETSNFLKRDNSTITCITNVVFLPLKGPSFTPSLCRNLTLAIISVCCWKVEKVWMWSSKSMVKSSSHINLCWWFDHLFSKPNYLAQCETGTIATYKLLTLKPRYGLFCLQ